MSYSQSDVDNFIDPEFLINCTPDTCPIDTSFYNYRLSLPANIIFLVIFSLCLVANISIWIYTRRGHFFGAVMILGCITEIFGYVGRVWSYYNQWDENPFMMQIACLTLAPAFFSAGIYVCLARLVVIYGRDNSRLKPLWYTYIFIPCDIIALILQAIGGGMCGGALTGLDVDLFLVGARIMIAGLAWQVFTLFCFMAFCADFGFRVSRRRRRLGDSIALTQEPACVESRSSVMFHLFLPSLGAATLLIFWRCVFRSVELNDGFMGPVTYNQGLFIAFEGALVAIAAIVLVVLHPSLCFGPAMDVKVR